MSAREEILQRVRTALQDHAAPVVIPRDYRVAGACGAVDVELLIDRLIDYKARVHRVAGTEVPTTIDALVSGRVIVPDGFPQEWRPGTASIVGDQPQLTAQQLDELDAVVTTCVVAVAETGTIVLDHGAGQGRRALSLVPDHHVVVVREAQIVAGVPDAVAVLEPTRPQTWISGPSATSDIELERVEGVHGPRRLDIVLVSPDAAQPAAGRVG